MCGRGPSKRPNSKAVPGIWFVRLRYAGDLEDGSAKAGEWICGGGWIKIGRELRADGGLAEIEDACRAADMTGACELVRGFSGEVRKRL